MANETGVNQETILKPESVHTLILIMRKWLARIWNVIASFPGVALVAFSPDGSKLITASSDRAYVWDTVTGQQIHILDGHTFDVFSAAFSPDGGSIVTAGLDGSAKVWDTATGELLLSLDGHEGIIFRAVFSPDGQSIVTASADGSAKVWDTVTGRLLHSLDGHSDSFAAIYEEVMPCIPNPNHGGRLE